MKSLPFSVLSFAGPALALSLAACAGSSSGSTVPSLTYEACSANFAVSVEDWKSIAEQLASYDGTTPISSELVARWKADCRVIETESLSKSNCSYAKGDKGVDVHINIAAQICREQIDQLPDPSTLTSPRHIPMPIATPTYGIPSLPQSTPTPAPTPIFPSFPPVIVPAPAPAPRVQQTSTPEIIATCKSIAYVPDRIKCLEDYGHVLMADSRFTATCQTISYVPDRLKCFGQYQHTVLLNSSLVNACSNISYTPDKLKCMFDSANVAPTDPEIVEACEVISYIPDRVSCFTRNAGLIVDEAFVDTCKELSYIPDRVACLAKHSTKIN